MGANIIITKPNGSRVPIESRRTATGITAAKQNWALNAEDTINITVVSPFPQSYGIGDTITVFGRDYKLNRLPKVKKTGMAEFQYDLEFEGIQYDLFRVTYDLTIDTTNNELQDIQGDTLTGDLKRFMDVLVSNANRVFPGKWAVGVCPETIGDKTLTFGESDNCLSVLQTLCSQDNFNVEFEIEKVDGIYTINLYENVGQTLPFTFEYGKNKGLYSMTRENVSSANIITRLKVFGSTENITSKYRADRLCMFGKDKSTSYIEKAEAVAKYGIFEGRKNFDIKPTFTGKITAIVDGDVLSFVDETFPFDLNAIDANGQTLYLIAGVSAKVHFNTGNLAGYEFEVHAYDHATHKFTLVKLTDDRGDVFPSATSPAFQFGVNDTYKVLDIAYSKDIEEEAEKKLAEEGNKYYDQNSQPKVQYGVSVTKAYLERLVGTDDAIVNVFAPGDYLHIVDADIDVDKAIRIKSFVRNVLDPYEYTLTISDITKSATITNHVISELVDIDKVLTINNLKDPTRARANWRSSREVLNMVFDPEGDYYTDKIKPNSIDTLALSVGAKSMQFGLMNTVFQPNFQGNNNVVKWQGGVLTHYTINEEMAVSWVMADAQTTLTSNVPYYLYAKCEKKGTAGLFIFTTNQIKVDEDVNYYHFLVGTLSSIDPELNARSLALTYGFTMINGRFIQTGRICSSGGGATYFDLDAGEIGGKITLLSGSSGYNNLTDTPDLSHFWSDTDSIIEIWYKSVAPTTSNAPASSWNTTALKEAHIGDLYRQYNTTPVQEEDEREGEGTRVLKWYRWEKRSTTQRVNDEDVTVIEYRWVEITDIPDWFANIVPETLPSGAQKMFSLVTPTTPYSKGDIWLNGGVFMRSSQNRGSKESFVMDDWDDAGVYDNTQTTIDGGIVTSGRIQLAGDRNHVVAGVTGQGTADNSVRFWAGASYPQRAAAPFRVLQNGRTFCENLMFIGGGMFPGFVVNSSNLTNYATIVPYDGSDVDLIVIDIKKTGGHVILDVPNQNELINTVAFPCDSSLFGSEIELILGNCDFFSGGVFPVGCERYNILIDGTTAGNNGIAWQQKVSIPLEKHNYYRFKCLCYKVPEFPTYSDPDTVDNGYYVRWALVERKKLNYYN